MMYSVGKNQEGWEELVDFRHRKLLLSQSRRIKKQPVHYFNAFE